MNTTKCISADYNTGLQGFLSVIARHRNGDIISEFIDHNMIMSTAKTALANLIAGDGDDKVITHIALGNSDSMPTPDNNSIGSILSTNLVSGMNVVSGVNVAYLKSIQEHAYPEDGRVTFSWLLDFGEANGLTINEYGLVCSDKTLFSRKTRGTITKSSDLSISGEWTIIF